ncbi:MAG TPA: GNAT family N-acetyltransferase [Devosia sp.]|jgi:GNAT superfamily N-acetyltransferase|nr:GNAT family N-acetyltransferase [Devosia sp.]
MDVVLSVSGNPSADDLAALGDGLAQFNEADVGPADRQALAVLLHQSDGTLAGGLLGYTAWGWFYVQWLWLSEAQRGQGWAGRMLEAAEDEARRRGCHAAYIDTFNPVALRVYQRHGYAVFGSLPDFPRGRTRSFLQKSL